MPEMKFMIDREEDGRKKNTAEHTSKSKVVFHAEGLWLPIFKLCGE